MFFSGLKLNVFGDAEFHRLQYTGFMFLLQSFHSLEVNSEWCSLVPCSSVKILLFMLVLMGLGLDLGFNSIGR